MLFQNEESSLKLDIMNYEFPLDGGTPGSDDLNWLVLRCTWKDEDGRIIKDSNSCLLTYELQEMTTGLKVLQAGIKDSYQSSFVEPYFEVAAEAEEEDLIRIAVSFFLPNTVEDVETAEIECVMTRKELKTLVEEMDELCKKYPDRT